MVLPITMYWFGKIKVSDSDSDSDTIQDQIRNNLQINLSSLQPLIIGQS